MDKIYHHKKKIDKQKVRFMVAALILPIANFIIFTIYANISSIFMSFQKQEYVDGGVKLIWTLDNFKYVFTSFFADPNGVLLLALKNTLSYYAVGTFVVFPLSLFMSYFIYKRIAMYRVYRFIFYLPNIVTSAAFVMLFKYTIQTGGPLNYIYSLFGKDYVYPLTQVGLAQKTMLLYSILFGFGGNTVVFGGTLNTVNPELLEAGELDGCNWIQEFWFIIIPSIWPTISTMLILGLAGILGSSGSVLMFTKGEYETTTLSFELYRYVAGIGYAQDLYIASAIGHVMTIIIFPVVMFVKWLINKKED